MDWQRQKSRLNDFSQEAVEIQLPRGSKLSYLHRENKLNEAIDFVAKNL